MQIRITGEQPFQVLGTNFTIGPSSSGYDLYFSADGRSYSKLFSVGANTNRQVTQVAAGSYYLLSGNTSEVTINWMKDCGGGEGGGSYVLPTASENTLGGVKIGSGITIDANGAISAQGGGSEAFKVTVSSLISEDWTSDDYSALTEMVEYLSGKTEMVEAYIDAVSMDEEEFSEGERFTLSYMDREGAVFSYPEYGSNMLYELYLKFEDVESSEITGTEIPEGGAGYVIADTLEDVEGSEEGTMAYVKGYNVSGWTIDATPFGDSEGFCAYVHYDGTSSKTNIYYAGGQFHWGWNNDQAEWGPGQHVNYKIDRANKLFYVYCDNPDAYIEPASPETATITPTVFNIPVKELYLNNGTDWEKKEFVKLYFLDNMSNEERADLYDEITTNYIDRTFPAWKYRFFVGSYDNDEFLGNFEVFVARFESDSIQFSGLMSSRYDPTLLMRGYTLEDNGSFSNSFSANKILPNAPYDPFVIASYDNNNMCLTGITHDTKATMWEGYKQEGSEYMRKTIIAYIHTGDNLPARFHLIYADGDFEQDEDNAALYFGGIYNSVGDSMLHSVRFKLTKDVANDIYTIDNIAEYNYPSQI